MKISKLLAMQHTLGSCIFHPSSIFVHIQKRKRLERALYCDPFYFSQWYVPKLYFLTNEKIA